MMLGCKPCQRTAVRGGVENLIAGNPHHGDGENQSHGAGIKKTFDDVDGNLRAERETGLFRDEIGANGIGNAADERNGGEPDDLGTDERKRGDFLCVADQKTPAKGAKDEAKVNAGGSETDEAPVSERDLGPENAEIEVNAGTGPESQSGKRREHDKACNPLASFQSVSSAGIELSLLMFSRGWSALWRKKG